MGEMTSVFVSCLLFVCAIDASTYTVPVHRKVPSSAVMAAISRLQRTQPLRHALNAHAEPLRNTSWTYDPLLFYEVNGIGRIPLPQTPRERRSAALSRCPARMGLENLVMQDVRSDSADKTKRRLLVSTEFVSCDDITYYGQIGLGKPAQPLQVSHIS
jgi:hypothetical protein